MKRKTFNKCSFMHLVFILRGKAITKRAYSSLTTLYAIMVSAFVLSSCRQMADLATVDIVSVDYLTHSSVIINANLFDDGGDFVSVKGVCWSKTSPATTQDNCSDRGHQGIGCFTSPLYNLEPGTLYYVRAFAKNVAGTAYSKEIRIRTNPEIFVDPRDGQIYPVITIGNQDWLATNLNFFTPEGSSYYNNDSIKYGKFGRLYTWYMAREACPPGWRLPGCADWNQLFSAINNDIPIAFNNYCEDFNAHKLKMPGMTMWFNEYGDDLVNNASGFSAVAAGIYSITRKFMHQSFIALFWSNNELDASNAGAYSMSDMDDNICINGILKESKISVRCIRE